MGHDIFAAIEDSSPDVLREANVHGFDKLVVRVANTDRQLRALTILLTQGSSTIRRLEDILVLRLREGVAQFDVEQAAYVEKISRNIRLL